MIAVQEQKIEQQEQDDVYIKEKTKELSTRVASLEKWKWFTLGGAGVIGFVLAKLSMLSSLIS